MPAQAPDQPVRAGTTQQDQLGQGVREHAIGCAYRRAEGRFAGRAAYAVDDGGQRFSTLNAPSEIACRGGERSARDVGKGDEPAWVGRVSQVNPPGNRAEGAQVAASIDQSSAGSLRSQAVHRAIYSEALGDPAEIDEQAAREAHAPSGQQMYVAPGRSRVKPYWSGGRKVTQAHQLAADGDVEGTRDVERDSRCAASSTFHVHGWTRTATR